jgi:cellulose synthase (UDP-forming)
MALLVIKNQIINKYQFVYNNVSIFRLYLLLNLICVVLNFYSFYPYLNSNQLARVIFLPFVVINFVFFITSIFIAFLYKKFDVVLHKAMVRSNSTYPTVDVLLPVCGEDLNVIAKTWEAVKNLDYPNFKTWVLDDKGDKRLEMLAKVFGFTYLSRPDKGYMKKAGNLRYGFGLTSSELVAILDADFVPDPRFLIETVPYLVKNPLIAIVQTPQYFACSDVMHKDNMLEYGAGQIQEEFYKQIQVSRDKIQGSICVGSNALYSRKALDTIGGTYLIEHSEDVWTGIALNMKGYIIKYIPVILARGLSPQSLDTFVRQQYRWCQGTISIAMSTKFWTSKISWGARLSFLSGLVFYLTSFGYFLLPFSVFLVIFLNPEAITFANSIYFYPGLILTIIASQFLYIQRIKFGSLYARFFSIAANAMAIIHSLLGVNLAWTPTGKKTQVNFWVRIIIIFSIFYSLAYLSLTGIAVNRGFLRFNYFEHYSILGWIVYNNILFASFAVLATRDLFSYKPIEDAAKPVQIIPKGKLQKVRINITNL